jgi:hypothetical protein
MAEGETRRIKLIFRVFTQQRLGAKCGHGLQQLKHLDREFESGFGRKKTAVYANVIRRPGFDSRHYEKKKVVALERGPLSLVSTIEELLDGKVVAPV